MYNLKAQHNSRVLKLIGKKREIYEAVLIIYLHLTNIFDSILKAMEGKSYSWQMKEEFMAAISSLTRFNLADTVGDMGLQSIFKQGRFTNKVTEFAPPKSIRLSVQGLASFLYKSPSRIIFAAGEIFVRALGGNIYHVSSITLQSLNLRFQNPDQRSILQEMRTTSVAMSNM